MNPKTPAAGLSFLDLLVQHGIIQYGEQIRRVIIDAEINDAVKIYVERYADERLLDIVTPLAGFEVQVIDPSATQSSATQSHDSS